ncbi:MAG: UDP-3-O-(3-hydroxymyristoyl)glucosamine N-acyltransferase [Verrucomicrobiota bacterium]|jgi:UDP-3-O-[3-hydroxymyristoyl] glucosamine N-acyltransferase|nr:UDP-3-O-(3-hydroxymyristoyl)glucosamine N-acyltransferase [Verrucomicrobiota bacterium]
MNDQHPFHEPVPIERLAGLLSASIEGDSTLSVRGIASLDEAGRHDLSFLGNSKYNHLVATSHAGALLLPHDFAFQPKDGQAVLRVAKPYEAFAQCAALFYTPPRAPEGIHPTAIVDPSAELGREVGIGPYVVIGPNVRLGDRVKVFPHCTLYEYCSVGDDTVLHSHVVLRERVSIGKRCIFHNHVVIGADGFGYVRNAAMKWVKIPQTGSTVIGDDVEIGAFGAADRAALGFTRVHSGVKLDNMVQLGHGDQVGEDSLLCGQVGVSGSVRIGKRCILAGKVGVRDHISIADDITVAGMAGITNDLEGASVFAGFPAVPSKEWIRSIFSVKRIPQLLSEMRALKQELEELRSQVSELQQSPQEQKSPHPR